MEQYVNEITSTAHQLSSIGFEINQEWLGAVLLAGFSERYQPMIMALENSGLQITGDSVKTKLLQESGLLDKSYQRADSDSAYYTKRQNDRTKHKQNARKTKCWSCGKFGHMANECNEKKKEDKEKKKTDQTKKKNENSKVAFLANEVITEENSAWIVDSTASAHMSPNKNLFDSFEDIQQSRVIVADNTRLHVKGSGSINIPISVKGETRKVTIKEVLYVPDLNVNYCRFRKSPKKVSW